MRYVSILETGELKIMPESLYLNECICKGCMVTFETKEQINKHRFGLFSCITSSIYCKKCGVVLPTESLLKLHQKNKILCSK
jgi:hypothetical protein